MADRYWVNGSGNWNNSVHWDSASGGPGGASVPTSSDNVIIDNNSVIVLNFCVITINVPAFTRDFIAVLTSGSKIFNVVANDDITVAGSVDMEYSAFPSGAFWSGATGKKMYLSASTSGNTVVTNNIGSNLDLVFQGTGSWTVTKLDHGRDVELIEGDLTITATIFDAHSFVVDTPATKSLTLGNSHLAIGNEWAIVDASGLTFDAGTSSIQVSDQGSGSFQGGDQTYYDVELFADASVMLILDDNSYHILLLDGGERAYVFESGSTQTAATFKPQSSSIIRASTAGHEAFISADVVDIGSNLIVSDSHALGAAIPFDARSGGLDGIDGGGNTNWLFEVNFIRARPIYLN